MPTIDDVRKLRGTIKNASDVEYAFSKLRSAKWVPLLAQEGLFSSPYEPMREGDGMLFPSWPPSRFLARISAEDLSRGDQEAIIAAALEIPETKNVRIHRDLAEAALGLDADLSARLVPKAAVWVQSPYALGLPRELGKLISHLAEGGQAQAAILLAESVLAVEEAPRSRGLDADDSPLRNLRQPAPRFDLWDYERILKENLPDLVDAAGEQSIGLLCDLLDRSILLSDRRGTERRPDDVSTVWRPAIEDHPQNFSHDVNDILVNAVRNSAEQLAREDPRWVSRLATMFDDRAGGWRIFRRFSLHLLRKFPDAAINLIQDRLLSRSLFDSLDVRHEYFLLQKDCFGLLRDNDKNTVLSWIDQGPTNVEAAGKRWQVFTGQLPTDEWNISYIHEWKRDHLTPLHEYLDPVWKKTYGDLVAAAGPAAHPEFTSYHTGGAWIGPSSPVGSEEISKMSVGELVEYLESWQPPLNRLHGSTPDGLGEEITESVSLDTEKFTAKTADLERLKEPTYARAVISGFDRALHNGTKFDWAAVLRFCAWVVAKPRDIPGHSDEPFAGVDPNWGWARATILRLLTAGFVSKENSIPVDLRELVWAAIEPVTHDPDPTVENEEKYLLGGIEDKYRKRGMKTHGPDPFTSAINSVRGTAIETTVQYALWLRRETDKHRDLRETRSIDLADMPEVSRVLEEHLDPTIDSSMSIRSVYGHCFPWLHNLDRRWTEHNEPRIFSRSELKYWHAAWDTYICYCRPYDDVLETLRDEYAFAIQELGKHTHNWGTAEAPDVNLAQHLATFYWRGKLSYEEELLRSFYHKAGIEVRRRFIAYLGRGLREFKGAIPNDVAERLMHLWTERLRSQNTEKPPGSDELTEYGWWFSSGKLDNRWLLAQLLDTLRVAKRVDPDFMVVERLSQLSKEYPGESIEALRMMVEGDIKGWGLLGWADKAKEIIRSARRLGNEQARRKAEDLVNFLGSRGHFEFGEILKESIE